MKKRILFFFITFLIACILIYFVFKKIGAKEIWQTFLSFSPIGIFVGAILTMLLASIGIWRWKVVLKDRGCPLSFKELILPWLGGMAAAYFTPVAVLGDEAFKIYFLKEKFSIPLKKATSSVFIEDSILEGSIFLSTIFLGIIFFILRTMAIPLELWMIILILLFPIGGIIFFYFKAFKNQSIVKLIEGILKKFLGHRLTNGAINYEKEVFNFFKTQNKNLWEGVLLSLFYGVVNLIRSWTILWFLGLKINLITALSVVAFTNLAYLLPLPAGLGSLETIQALVFSPLGLTPQAAVSFSLILRAFDSILYSIGFLFTLRYGTKQIKREIFN